MPSAPFLGPTREPGSPGTVPLAVYNTACRDRDLFRQERDAARLVAEAASRLRRELEGAKKVCVDLQDKLLESGRHKARLEIL